MKPLVSPPLPRLAAVAATALLLLAVACGPESFDRGRHKDAAAADARADGAGESDGGSDGAEDMGALADADLDGAGGDEVGADGGGDAADARGGDATDARDGGAADAGCRATYVGDLLHVFDTGGSIFTGPAPDPAGPLPPSWFAYGDTGSSPALRQSTTGWSATEGRSCPGALALTANFTVYAAPERVMALYNFNANWAAPKAYVRLHAWVKVVQPTTGNLDHLDSLQLATNTNGYTAFRGAYLPASVFADFGWHEIVEDLTPGANYVPTDVLQIGVQMIAKGTAPAGGPAAPVPTSLFVDDIWLEL